MSGAGFAYFRWHNWFYPGDPRSDFVARVRRSMWLDMQQRAFHRKIAGAAKGYPPARPSRRV